jgi:hypothetical protein
VKRRMAPGVCTLRRLRGCFTVRGGGASLMSRDGWMGWSLHAVGDVEDGGVEDSSSCAGV